MVGIELRVGRLVGGAFGLCLFRDHLVGRLDDVDMHIADIYFVLTKASGKNG